MWNCNFSVEEIMSQLDKEIKIFALNSNKPLAEKIADKVGVKLGKSDVKRFSDGEIQINQFVVKMFI